MQSPVATVGYLNVFHVNGSVQHPERPTLQAHDHFRLVRTLSVRVEHHPETGNFGHRGRQHFRTDRAHCAAQDR